jgi:hypothetical protein
MSCSCNHLYPGFQDNVTESYFQGIYQDVQKKYKPKYCWLFYHEYEVYHCLNPNSDQTFFGLSRKFTDSKKEHYELKGFKKPYQHIHYIVHYIYLILYIDNRLDLIDEIIDYVYESDIDWLMRF